MYPHNHMYVCVQMHVYLYTHKMFKVPEQVIERVWQSSNKVTVNNRL